MYLREKLKENKRERNKRIYLREKVKESKREKQSKKGRETKEST